MECIWRKQHILNSLGNVSVSKIQIFNNVPQKEQEFSKIRNNGNGSDKTDWLFQREQNGLREEWISGK